MSEDHSQQSKHTVAWPILRPYCWVHGHEFRRTTYGQMCERCGLRPLDYLWVAIFVAPLFALYIRCKQFLTDSEEGDDDE